MIFKDLTVEVGGKYVTFTEVEIDLGGLDTDEQSDALQELIETTPDKHVIAVIEKVGTQELADGLKDWVGEAATAELEEEDEPEAETPAGETP